MDPRPADDALEPAPPSPGEPRAPARRFDGRGLLAALTPWALVAVFFLVDAPLCPTKRLFGVPCPGCGLTRASGALAHFDLAAMWAYHPLAPLVVPLVGWALLRPVLVAAGLARPAQGVLGRAVPGWVWGALLVLVLAVWGLRLAGLLGGHPDPIAPETGWLSAPFFH